MSQSTAATAGSITTRTCWILGAGASFDCIGPGRTCIPVTRSLINRNALPSDVLSRLEQLLAPTSPDSLDETLGDQLEQTIDWLMGLSTEGDEGLASRASECLRELIASVAYAVRTASIGGHARHGGTVGFSYAAENYFWLASMCAVYQEWSVLTLNWDCLLDRAFEEIQGIRRPPPHLDGWIRCINEYKLGSHEAPTLGGYAKLHGSLDLFFCLNRSCAAYRSPLANLRPKLRRREGGFEMFGLPGDKHGPCNKCGVPLTELLMPPGKNKTPQESSFLEHVHRLALYYLQHSSTWIFVGYSVPSYDIDVAHLLRQAITSMAIERSIFVVAPDAPSIAARLSKILGVQVGATAETFTSFVDNVMRIHGGSRPGWA